MKTKGISFVSIQDYNGDERRVPVKYDKRFWLNGKCRAFYCDNPIYFIKMSNKGYALLGYCYHLANNLPKCRKGTYWTTIMSFNKIKKKYLGMKDEKD